MRQSIRPLLAALLAVFTLSVVRAGPVDGCYVEPHTILASGDKPTAPDERTSVVDHLGIRKASGATYEFDLLVVGDYGHVCQAVGLLQASKKSKNGVFTLLPDETYQAMKEGGQALCKFTLEVRPKTIAILANEACNSQFACGVRAGIYQRSFLRSRRASETPKAPCFKNAS